MTLRSKCIGTLLLAIGVAAVVEAQPSYRVVDSGFPAEDAFSTTWINDRLVFFTGVELNAPLQPPDSRSTYRAGLKIAAFIWDTFDGAVTKFHDAPIRSFCSTGLYVSYQAVEQVSDRKIIRVFGGKFGEQKRLGDRAELPFFNPVSCRYHGISWLPPETKERRIAPLLEEHGYVDFGPRNPSRGGRDEANSPILRSLTGDKSVRLKIEKEYLENARMRFTFLPFVAEYFSRADTVDRSRLSPAFYMAPDGSVRKIQFSQDVRIAGSYIATKPGVLLITDGNRQGIDGGAYLLEHNQMTPVVRGAVRAASASPSGCRLAFIYAKSWDDIPRGYEEWKKGKAGNTLRMVDVCEGGMK